jgi:hypothetical protein
MAPEDDAPAADRAGPFGAVRVQVWRSGAPITTGKCSASTLSLSRSFWKLATQARGACGASARAADAVCEARMQKRIVLARNSGGSSAAEATARAAALHVTPCAGSSKRTPQASICSARSGLRTRNKTSFPARARRAPTTRPTAPAP